MNNRSALAATAVVLMSLCVAACGGGVNGHTYAAPGGMVQIEFQSGGKAVASMGGSTADCTYTQSGERVTLICEGVTEQLTVGSDGTLTGPPDGMLGHLTKVK